jgi:hypothetical protein
MERFDLAQVALVTRDVGHRCAVWLGRPDALRAESRGAWRGNQVLAGTIARLLLWLRKIHWPRNLLRPRSLQA